MMYVIYDNMVGDVTTEMCQKSECDQKGKSLKFLWRVLSERDWRRSRGFVCENGHIRESGNSTIWLGMEKGRVAISRTRTS